MKSFKRGCEFILEKENLPYIILLTHGNWGQELIKSAEMICGTLKNVYAFPLQPAQSTDDYMVNIESVVKTAPKGSIIIADLFRGTTSNIAAAISAKYDVIALSGLNIAMLIEANEYRTKYKGEELSEKLIEKATENCKNIGKILRESKYLMK